MDDDRRPDPVAQLLRDFVYDVSEHVVVPEFAGGRMTRRPHHRTRPGWRGLAVGFATVAVVGAIVLAVVDGPRSSQIGSGPVPGTQSPPGTTSTTAASPYTCADSQLSVTVAFNQSGGAMGAIKLTNVAAQACSLSGQPRVVVLDGGGKPLTLSESAFHQAPDWPPPQGPIALSPVSALPQAIVELDWTWCGIPPGRIQFEIQFPGWPSPLTVPNSAISPAPFGPAPCTDSGGHALLAVDDVRGFGRNGIIGPSQDETTDSPPLLGADRVGSVSVGTPRANAVTTMDQSLGQSTATATGVCPGRTEVEWGDLSLEFSAGVLVGYRYDEGGFPALGTARRPAGLPQPLLKTATGATLGMTLRQVRPLYQPDAFSSEQGGAIVVAGTTTGDRLFLGFFESAPSTPLTEIKGGAPCGDV